MVSARGARKKRWICFFIILIVLIIIAIVVAIEVVNVSGLKTYLSLSDVFVIDEQGQTSRVNAPHQTLSMCTLLSLSRLTRILSRLVDSLIHCSRHPRSFLLRLSIFLDSVFLR